MSNFITLENYKDSNILKGFQTETKESKPTHTFESIQKSLEGGLEKGLISQELYEKSLEELDSLKTKEKE